VNDGLFVRESIKARTMAMVEPERADYWHGYRHGLRRGYLGEQVGNDEDHQVWLAAAESDDAMRAARGRGYRDGLNV
jgi:hypothetical protein